MPAKAIAAAAGLENPVRMKRAFDRELGLVHSIVVALCQRMKRSGGRNIKLG